VQTDKAAKLKTAVGASVKCCNDRSLRYGSHGITFAAEMVFTETSKDVEYSFKKNK